MITIALAVLLSQAEPVDEINDHVRGNIRIAVHSATSAAVVTVVETNDKTTKLHIDEVVQGELPLDTDVVVPLKGFYKPDLARGAELLVYFRGKPGALSSTGHYELIFDGKIREYDRNVYLARAKWEAAQALPKTRVVTTPPAATPEHHAAVHTAGAPHTGG